VEHGCADVPTHRRPTATIAVATLAVISLILAPGWVAGAEGVPVRGAMGGTGPVVQSSGPAWQLQAVAHPSQPEGTLAAVACLTISDCIAVGYDIDAAGTDRALAEAWNGTAWTLLPTPNPNAAGLTQLSGISCTGPAACTAVGQSYSPKTGTTGALAEAWNGTAWSIEATPDPAGATATQLSAVSCSSTFACSAVGQSGTSALAESWNGTAWAIEATPAPAGSTDSALSSVSCPAGGTCTAVGDDVDSAGGDQPLAESWNGTAWTIGAPVDIPSGDVAAQFSGVSCPSATVCTAVGSADTTAQVQLPLAESWNGAAWTVETVPAPAGGTGALSAVSCTMSGACMAAGFAQAIPLAEGWASGSWTVEPKPPVAVGAYNSQLTGVSCLTEFSCRAVGYGHVPPVDVTLAAAWNGAGWVALPTVNRNGGMQSSLQAISCVVGGLCEAVGAAGGHPLAERWNGTNWVLQATPLPAGAGLSVLDGVSCAGPDACVAVGYYQRAVFPEKLALAESWNGTRWHQLPVPPPPGDVEDALTAVSCAAPTACTAVGFVGDLTLAAAWNGVSWTLQPTPDVNTLPYDNYTHLNGVSCSSAVACLAVGYTYLKGDYQLYAAYWNGILWSNTPTPQQPVGVDQQLLGLSCSSSGACTAVGYDDNASGDEVPLAESWNGQTWMLQAAPGPVADPDSQLLAISCPYPTSCTAVGFSSAGQFDHTLAETWNGTAWSIGPTRNPPSAIGDTLNGVSCLGPACTAVGVRYERGTMAPVAETRG
jgi:hypothetical protein